MTTPGSDPSETGSFSSPLVAPWATYTDIPEAALSKVALGDEDEWLEQLWIASELLFAMTGRRWRGEGGERDLTVRSVRPRPADGLDWPYSSSWGRCRCWAWGDIVEGVPVPPSAFRGQHATPRAIRLPDADVTEVTEVRLDGAPLAAEAWSWSGDWLHRRGRDGWPVCGDRLAVAYRYGFPPPRGGRSIAWRLAVEYAKHAVGDDQCRLPSRVTSVARQNITMTFGDPEKVAKDRLTGVPAFDSWITSVNPYLRPAEAVVISPDVPTARS